MKLFSTRITALLLISVTMVACRGQKSDKPPVMPQQNMAFQERFNAQQENPFFEDQMAMRLPVEGTVARGGLRHDDAMFKGRTDNGDFVDDNPMELTRSFLYRGKDRYDIFCAVCHGGTGDGRGIIMEGEYGYVPAPTFHSDRSREMPDGEIYDAIANGIRSMPAYSGQINVEDRWAIVAYIRALQESQNVTEDDLQQFDVDIAQLQENYRTEQARLEALAEARAVRDEDEVSVERGERLYTRYACHTCHSTDGTRLVGPTFAGLYMNDREMTDGSVITADEDYLKQAIVDPRAFTNVGYDDVMQPYDYLSDGELQSLVEFIKSLADN